MVSRLLTIGFLLCLPIVIALLSQQMTRTVAPPKLPAAAVEARLLGAPRSSRNAGMAENGVPQGYVPRAIQHFGVDEADYNPAADEQGAGSQANAQASAEAEQAAGSAAQAAGRSRPTKNTRQK